MRQTWHPREIEFRRERYERQLVPTFRERSGIDVEDEERIRAAQRPELLTTVEAFLAGAESAEGLRDAIQRWTAGKPLFGFSGFAGAMSLNQMVKDAPAGDAEGPLRRVITVPTDLDDAVAKLEEFAEWVVALRRTGSGVQIGRVPFFASWFWWLQDRSGWQPMWTNAKNGLLAFGWLVDDKDNPGDYYRAYHDLLAALDDDRQHAWHVLSWFGTEEHRAVLGLDPTIIERNAWVTTIPSSEPSPDDVAAHTAWTARLRNAEQMLLDVERVGEQLRPVVEDVLGGEMRSQVVSPYWVNSPEKVTARNDQYVRWQFVEDPQTHPPVRFRVDRERVTVAVHTYHVGGKGGYTRELRKALGGEFPDGVSLYKQVWDGGDGVFVPDDRDWTDAAVELDVSSIAAIDDLRAQVRAAVETLAEPFHRAHERISAGAATAETSDTDDLTDLVGTFRAATGYPGGDDLARKAEAAALAAPFQRAVLGALSKQHLKALIAPRYGNPGPHSHLHRVINEADDEEWTRIIQSIRYLLWSDDDLARRIDRIVDHDDPVNVSGLGEAMTMKLLAVTRPDEIIPVYPFTGDSGKAGMLTRLGLPVPDMELMPGRRQVESNRILRGLLDPHFPGDLWGQSRFLYWLLEERVDDAETDAADVDTETGAIANLTALAPKLYLEPEDLLAWYDQLRTTRQVIFYGPPGTGKTHIAQEMAKAIAPEDSHRMLVQFHPSYGYEDFVEGYRPVPNRDGDGFTYQLFPGPLVRMAEAARAEPGRPHILIIDEINRANLPRVLGELLFLLEYRDRSANLLYRPEEAFELPENLWIIGTMNTADRSVALIDAAMRRRFRFIDFTPDVEGNNPIARVLERWVDEEGQLEVLPDFVDRVNNSLADALGGRHLVLGPSYFMRLAIDETMLREIWDLQIRPLIEDLFFGNPEMQKRFSFDAMWAGSGGDELAIGDAVPLVPGDDAAELGDAAESLPAGDAPR